MLGNRQKIVKILQTIKNIKNILNSSCFFNNKGDMNLDEYKNECDNDPKWFHKESVVDEQQSSCNLIYELDNCYNEIKNYQMTLNLPGSSNHSNDYNNYDTYLKKDEQI